MNRFENIEQDCHDALLRQGQRSNYAFESGYYKAQTKILCQEVEFLKQELESTIQQIKDVMKDLA
jgi:hypothetical protein